MSDCKYNPITKMLDRSITIYTRGNNPSNIDPQKLKGKNAVNKPLKFNDLHYTVCYTTKGGFSDKITVKANSKMQAYTIARIMLDKRGIRNYKLGDVWIEENYKKTHGRR